jgi:hypothetical protein
MILSNKFYSKSQRNLDINWPIWFLLHRIEENSTAAELSSLFLMLNLTEACRKLEEKKCSGLNYPMMVHFYIIGFKCVSYQGGGNVKLITIFQGLHKHRPPVFLSTVASRGSVLFQILKPYSVLCTGQDCVLHGPAKHECTYCTLYSVL